MATEVCTLSARGDGYVVQRFTAKVTAGPDRGLRADARGDELSIGTVEGNDLRLTDSAISRHHLVIKATRRGLEIRDLDSTNGTFVGGIELVRAFVSPPIRISLGRTTIELELAAGETTEPLAAGAQFPGLVGTSTQMRRLFGLLERCAASDATVLVTGETGTGKEVVAEAIHRASRRRPGPFVVVDCGALPRTLLESELFGHRRGAFTGADADRVGAFQAAHGGTLFLDELGELPLEVQPVLLRALEARRFRPVGADRDLDVDIRVIAATNRELREDVNHGRFRADLYFRLNVLRVEVPPLREREQDAVLLAEHFWRESRPDVELPAEVRTAIKRERWPGNVRELRNAIERASIVGWAPRSEPAAAVDLGFAAAKDVAVEAWEKDYLTRLLEVTGGNLSRAARAARMSRSHLRMLMQRHDIMRDDFT